MAAVRRPLTPSSWPSYRMVAARQSSGICLGRECMAIDRARIAFAVASAGFVCACSAPSPTDAVSTTESAITSGDLAFPVTVRGTGTATIAAHVFENSAHRGAVTVLAVHGLAETGFIFEPLA